MDWIKGNVELFEAFLRQLPAQKNLDFFNMQLFSIAAYLGKLVEFGHLNNAGASTEK